MTNDPNAAPGVCPKCGCTSEDFIGNGDSAEYEYECPQCGLMLDEDDILSAREWCWDRAEDDRLHYAEEDR